MKIPSLKLPNPAQAVSALKSNLQKAQTAATKIGQGAMSTVQKTAGAVQKTAGTVQKTVPQAANKAQRAAGDVFTQGKKALDGAGAQLQKAVGDKFNRLSDAEKRFLSTNLHLAKPFSDAADKADALSSQYANKNLKGADKNIYGDSAANALRHATWNALMVKRANDNLVGGGNITAAAKKAYEFATAHEDNPKNTIEVNKKMDLHNNSVGRNVALEVLRKNPKATDEQLFQAVVDAFKQGKLREVSGKQLVTAS
jgi:hypothetical protein